MANCVLVFSGSDPSGGAGLQADIAAIGALGCHPLSVPTALTVQDNARVFAVHPLDPDLVRHQARVLVARCQVAAVKIGIVGSRANAEAIATVIADLRQHQADLPVVLDPVLASGHGDSLSRDDAVAALAPLLALATIVTPNLPEAARLTGDLPAAEQAAQLLRRGCANVLLKGGHGPERQEVVNRWYGPGAAPDAHWRWPRLEGQFHGSGCTLASALAACLARGLPLFDALTLAQHYTQQALAGAYAIAAGQRIPNRFIRFDAAMPGGGSM